MPLQRRMSDFGADLSFERACERLQEHYGITVPNSAERRVTEEHAKGMREQRCLQKEIPEQGAVDRVIAETDGTSIPIVIMDSDKQEQPCADRLKVRKVTWQEGGLTLARQEGSVTPIFGATMGERDQAGDHWLDCAIRAGFNLQSEVHCIRRWGVLDCGPSEPRLWDSGQFPD